MSLTFRNTVTTTDVTAVRDLVASTNFFHPAETAIAVELVEERMAKGAASGYYFVFAERLDSLIGYACFGEIPCTVGSYDLYWIAVSPESQGDGLGKKLVQRVEQEIAAVGGRLVCVDTAGREQYIPTRRFYESAGYREEARIADFYAPGDDKVVYCKNI